MLIWCSESLLLEALMLGTYIMSETCSSDVMSGLRGNISPWMFLSCLRSRRHYVFGLSVHPSVHSRSLFYFKTCMI